MVRHLIPVLCLSFLVGLLSESTVFAQANSANGNDLSSNVDWEQQRLEATVLATELMRPMELEVAADGTIYYIELEGDIKSLSPESGEIKQIGKVPVTTEQENGLIGLALDPNFSENHWVYLQFSPPDYQGQHICRFTLVDGELDLDSRHLLFKYPEQRKQCCHHAGSLEFGPDGCLYIASGDNTNPFEDSQGYSPTDERPGREAWDAQRSSANSRSGNGKVLRIRPLPDGTYEIPDGNLFPKDGSQGLPEVYVMGCRNPWRISIDQQTGFLYWGDVGPDAGVDSERGPRGHDEINQAREAGFFGWPYFNADNKPYADVDFSTGKVGSFYDAAHPINDSPNNTGVRQLPPAQPAMIFYPGATSPEFPELASGGRTACAGPVYHFDANSDSATKLPEAMDGALLIYEWTRHWVKVVQLDHNGNVKSIQPFMPHYTFSRPVDMCLGPEGSLYVLEYGETWGVNKDARLIRVDYMRGNRSPVAVASAENNIGRHPLKVSLSGKGSSDRDLDPLTYQWRLIDTKNPQQRGPVLGEGIDFQLVVDQPGVYNAELTVTDPSGAFRTATVPVLVGNTRPEAKFITPRDGDFYDLNQTVDYKVVVTDAEDGTNDDQLLDDTDMEMLDLSSTDRVVVSVWPSSQPFARDGGDSDNDPPGMKLMKGSDCFNCHAVDQDRVGPRLVDIAEKYRDQVNAQEASVQRVINGSTGVWGKIPMIPHSHHSQQEVREMVSWIFGLKKSGQVQIRKGFVGQIPTASAESHVPNFFRLDVNYTDQGHGEVPALTGSSSVYLRPRKVEGEQADEINGPTVLNSGRASGGQFIGAINHGNTLVFRDVNWDQVGSLQLSVASAGAGGSIQLHLDKTDGPLIGEFEVKVNGDWEDFYQQTIDLPAYNDQLIGRRDLVVLFTHPTQAGGLMNLDSIEFQAK